MKIKFLFGLHNHQPVGNFEDVFSKIYKDCYSPFLDILEAHPKVRISLHYTGSLFEWIETNNPVFFEKLLKLVKKKQVELLGGGFYEPLLSVLPREDAIGQILMQRDFINEKFNVKPEGVWLAERIWDPTIPSILSEANIKYTIVDDTHFFNAGKEQRDMFGYYMTERHGDSVKVFPIDKFLRYSIPFREPEDTFNYFRKIQTDYGASCITFADDGEKFGVWPGTYDWVYKEKWLERFFKGIEENSDWIEMVTFGEYIKSFPPQGKVYLPMASYEEMMEWALPVESAIKFKAFKKRLSDVGIEEEFKPFISGGHWDNFLVKYPESNHMYKKMLYVSRKIKNIKNDSKVKEAAKRELYKGQCNCSYWHGLFGGLYLNYLRHAIYSNLICAENIIESYLQKNGEWLNFEEIDFDTDGQLELLVSNPFINIYFDPDSGGSLIEMDYKPKKFNITNVLSRRKEAYHDEIKKGNAGGDGGAQPKSIHDMVKTKEEGLEDILFYDRYLKRGLLDHFFDKETAIDDVHKSTYLEAGDFLESPYDYTLDKKEGVVEFRRVGSVIDGDVKKSIEVIKKIRFYKNKSSLSSCYEIVNLGDLPVDLWFGVEFNFTLLAGDDPQRYYYIPGVSFGKKPLISQGEVDNTNIFCMRDDFNDFEIILKLDKPSSFWYMPIETVSQSENGVEKTYQGSTILPHFKFNLMGGEKNIIKMEIEVSNTKK